MLKTLLVGWAVFAGAAVTANAADQAARPPTPLRPIVVTGTKPRDSVADARLKKDVETAMRSDRYFCDEHVTVTIMNGVVALRGIVFDEWDLRSAIRISKKVSGVKRVINDLEIKLGGE
jgi:hypothetical protein